MVRDCGGRPVLRVRRYVCGRCGADVASHFLFDGLVFDAEYFRQKVAEHRERQRERRERIRQMLAETRSEPVQPPLADLAASPGLVDALDALTKGIVSGPIGPQRARFDLERYEAHILAHIGPFDLSLDQIPPLGENARQDRVWRFIAVIFLAHARLVDVRQAGPTIMVMKRETDSERQDLPDGAEATDGSERPLGRVEAG